MRSEGDLSILYDVNRLIFHISVIPERVAFVYDSTVAWFAHKEQVLWQMRVVGR
jgi:hypothetical protein